ncbi:MAG: exodeoxyribonuclease VII large subunit [Verrucomicrobia bacterium]|nr:MAG: exodeoxyribonuclease VII large subunit [Verrucomicrobiota bacterium]
MSRPAASQWEFGELFPAQQQQRNVLSVAELTRQIKRLLENQVGQVWVTGEISNFSSAPSGHLYFTVKDSAAQLSCVLFRGEALADRSLLKDGRKVLLQGNLTVYEPRGSYQLRVTQIELEGLGALQVAFEKLKLRLQAEGLFDSARKRPLPKFAQRIGLVTSPTGAAIRDVLHVIGRRNPSLEIILVPCRVQGQGAAEEIAAAIRLLNEFGRLDLILITRGGGSLEDLWAFNEEVVARAIFSSALPVVSAVGHEIDFTISDFVADVRAATPSAAAEIITEGVFASCQFVLDASRRMRQLLSQQIGDKNHDFDQMTQRLARAHPRRRLDEGMQRLDDAQSALLRCIKNGLRQHRSAWQNLAERLGRVRPAVLLKQRREVLVQASERLHEQAHHRVREWRNRLQTLEARLGLLGPEQVLARGYSITQDAQSGDLVRDAKRVKPGQRLRTRLNRGEVLSRAEGSD